MITARYLPLIDLRSYAFMKDANGDDEIASKKLGLSKGLEQEWSKTGSRLTHRLLHVRNQGLDHAEIDRQSAFSSYAVGAHTSQIL
eukprot:scaffold66010_cov54-Attheya_sp.AAC.6